MPFFTLGNIKPAYRSTFKAIFLVAVARTKDIEEYGIDAFLKPFVEDLKELYLNGFTVFEGEPGEKKGFLELSHLFLLTQQQHTNSVASREVCHLQEEYVIPAWPQEHLPNPSMMRGFLSCEPQT